MTEPKLPADLSGANIYTNMEQSTIWSPRSARIIQPLNQRQNFYDLIFHLWNDLSRTLFILSFAKIEKHT